MKTLILFFSTLLLFLTGTAQDPVADNMLLYQRAIGGWPKHINEIKIDYNKTLSEGEKAGLLDDKYRNDATIDNQATSKEIRYLVGAFAKTGNKAYLAAAEDGVRYLLKMQHANGGFPQFYPDSSSYRAQITYNDNAMVNALNILWDVAHRSNGFEVMDAALVGPSEQAVKKGIDCILKTQIRVKGKLTGWCAQHDRRTLEPVKARAFELVSISGAETVGIIEFLMKVEQPSDRVRCAINCAVRWLEASKIEGYKYTDIKDETQPKGFDRVLVPEAGSTVWARFYEVDTNRPFVCGRDGIRKYNLAELEYERRTGYAWYGTWAQKLLTKTYPAWKAKHS